jgi:phosphoenolpyruvate carboxylase
LKGEKIDNHFVDIGFWPGGDRDGNPFVTTEITLKVAERLKKTVLLNYYRDVRKLKRRITFPVVDKIMAELEKDIYDTVYDQRGGKKLELDQLIIKLKKIKKYIIKDHKSLFLSEIESLINKVTLFGFHFATLDIRQDSRVHNSVFEAIVKETENKKLNIFPKNYLTLSQEEQIKVISKVKGKLDIESISDELTKKTLGSIYAMKQIQKENGERGAHRYIISNNQTALNVMQTYAMIHLCGWKNPSVDIIPLFETVPDLQNAHEVMEELYSNPEYFKHLEKRGKKQTIMLGFSDGTKDGGYLMANWGIYKAKEALTEVSRRY